MHTLGVDIGGTKVLAGVVDNGAIIARTRRPTGATAADIEAAIVDAIFELSSQFPISAVGVAAAGFISRDRSTILNSPNIRSWDGINLTERIAEATELPIFLENDANAAAWGEFRFGAGIGVTDLLMVTVGTGVGGGIILDGVMSRGGFGIGAEVGHMCVVPDGRPCGCGQNGCLEQYASGSALVRSVRERTGQEMSGAEITAAANQGEEFALAAFDEIGEWLGRGIASAVSLLDPAAIVIGGGVGDAGDLLITPTRAAFEKHLPATSVRPHAPMLRARLGSDAGVIGVADLSK